MKFLFASDIHGSAWAAREVLRRLEEEKAERFFLLGDLLYHGPRNDYPRGYDTREVTRLLNESPITPLCVRGNCDSEVDQMVLSFPMMADYALLPLCGGRAAFLTHGHLFHTQCPPPHQKGDLLIHGHTHVHGVWPVEDYIYVNPGSASLPKEGQEPSYMILTENCLEIKNLETGTVLVHFDL